MKKIVGWTLGAMLMLLFLLSVLDWLNWPFQRQNDLIIAGAGFWMNVIGLALTIGGFGVTIEQLRRTRSVAEAARAEAERIKVSLNAYDLAHGASRAQYALAVTRRHIRNGMWSDAADSFEDFRKGLNSLKASGSLTPSQVERIDDASAYIQKLRLRIERSILNSNITIDVAKTMNVIRGHTDLIDEISASVQRGII